jgi:hypothetical protein
MWIYGASVVTTSRRFKRARKRIDERPNAAAGARAAASTPQKIFRADGRCRRVIRLAAAQNARITAK